jgi:hypothetical protein
MILISGLLFGGVAKATTADMLYSIQADASQLIHHGGQRFELVVSLKHIKSILAFSDRPKRMAFKLTVKDYLQLAHSGEHSFSKIPPNVVISFGTSKREAVAFSVRKIEVVDGYMYFELQSLVGLKKLLPFKNYHGRVSVYIDGGDRRFSRAKLSPSLATVDIAQYDSLPVGGSAIGFAFVAGNSLAAAAAI